MKFGVIKEGKNPPDKRVVLTPQACKALKETFKELEIIVEKSGNRTFDDQEYVKNGIEVTNDVSSADVLLGVKEVPIDALINDKKYFTKRTVNENFKTNINQFVTFDEKLPLWNYHFSPTCAT